MSNTKGATAIFEEMWRSSEKEIDELKARNAKLVADLDRAEDEYEKIAVVFNFEGAEDIIKKVAAKRAAEAKAAGKSKTIPEAAFDKMFKSFQKVDQAAEGFNKVVSVNNLETLKKVSDSMNERIRKNKWIKL
jgi:hypothetical protein